MLSLILSWLIIFNPTYKLTSLDYLLDQITICGNLVPTNILDKYPVQIRVLACQIEYKPLFGLEQTSDQKRKKERKQKERNEEMKERKTRQEKGENIMQKKTTELIPLMPTSVALMSAQIS